MRCLYSLMLAVWLAAPWSGRAHGDLHDQMASVTGQIQQEPANAVLYLKRGELHRAHGDWDDALADYDQAARLVRDGTDLDFFRGRLLLEAHRAKSARACLDRFLARQPDHAEALIVRARVLFQLGEGLAAAADFNRALGRLAEPKPDYYLERAQALISAGDARLEEAVRGLDEGMKRLGPLIALQLRAIDLEVARKNFAGALLRLDTVLEQSPRRETWLARRGEILLQAGRGQEAREAFDRALKTIESLPVNSRKTRAMLALENRVRSALGTPLAAANTAE